VAQGDRSEDAGEGLGVHFIGTDLSDVVFKDHRPEAGFPTTLFTSEQSLRDRFAMVPPGS
jgi:hypothetical protein